MKNHYDKKIKVAVIGSGYWGKNLIRCFYELGVLGYVCDTDKQSLDKIITTYNDVNVTSNFIEILDDKSIVGVVISLPAKLHYEYAKLSLQAEKHVFVEKPLSLNYKEAEELIELAFKQKKVLMVGHLLQYHPAFIKLKSLVNDGTLGKIHYIYSTRLNLGKVRTEENILWSFAPHDISMILSLVNSYPISIFSQGGFYLNHKVADVTVTTLDFPDNIKSHIFVSWLHPYKRHELVVIGENKMAVFDDMKQWKEKLSIFNYKVDWKENLPVPSKGHVEYISLEELEPLKNECSHFIECILTGKRPVTDGEEGLRVLKILEASQTSLDTGKVIYLDGSGSLEVNNFSNEKKNETSKEFFSHETSVVEKGAKIGNGTKIWHFSHIMSGAKIGNNCTIGQNVFVSSKASIGDNVKIQNNVSIYDSVEIHDNVFLGPSCVFTNVINPRAFIERKSEYKRTVVKRGATIGANATIVCGNEIGEYAFVGAGAVVTKNVPSYALVVGNPARQVGWVCKCGYKLEFDKGKTASCKECGSKYKLDDSNNNIIFIA